MKFQGGVKEAAKMLAGLAPDDRRRVFDEITSRDPQMAEALKNNMVSFEDLIYLTPKMLVELLREINISDLGMALRIASQELKSFILTNVSKGIRQDIEDILLGPLQPVSKVQESAEKIMTIVRSKVDKGELVLKEGGSEEYV